MTVLPSRTGTGGMSMPWVEEFGGFFDDAALFPRGNAPMATAVARHAVAQAGFRIKFEHHGFLNVLAAVAAAHDGADEEAVASVLACREPESVARWCTPQQRAAARAWFTSFGTCSIDEPLADLSALRLVGKD